MIESVSHVYERMTCSAESGFFVKLLSISIIPAFRIRLSSTTIASLKLFKSDVLE